MSRQRYLVTAKINLYQRDVLKHSEPNYTVIMAGSEDERFLNFGSLTDFFNRYVRNKNGTVAVKEDLVGKSNLVHALRIHFESFFIKGLPDKKIKPNIPVKTNITITNIAPYVNASTPCENTNPITERCRLLVVNFYLKVKP